MSNRVIAWVSGTLTLLLVVFSFILSYNNLVALAMEKGLPVPILFPWVVEFAVVVFSVSVLRRSMQGELAVWGWILVIGSSLTATTFNVIHAQNNLISQAMHAIPSVFMLLAFETFLAQLKEIAKRKLAVQSLAQLHTQITELEQQLTARRRALDTEVEPKQTALDKLHQQIEQASTRLVQVKKELEQAGHVKSGSIKQAKAAQLEQATVSMEHRRVQLVEILDTEGDIGASKLAERLNTSRGTVYNDLNALAEQGIVHKNGSGWQVLNRDAARVVQPAQTEREGA